MCTVAATAYENALIAESSPDRGILQSGLPFAKAFENAPDSGYRSENSEAGMIHKYQALNDQGTRDLTSSHEGQRN
jgi:hypothetical protein